MEEDRTPTLHMGDSILFKSNMNRLDSFLVTSFARKEFYTDKVFTSDYYAVDYDILNDDLYKCLSYGVAVEWDRTYIWWRYFYEGFMVDSPSTEMEINGIGYQNVKKISTDTTNLELDDVVAVYFSDQQGVLSYQLKSGEYFERIK